MVITFSIIVNDAFRLSQAWWLNRIVKFEPVIPMLGEASKSYGIAAVFFLVLVESISLEAFLTSYKRVAGRTIPIIFINN